MAKSFQIRFLLLVELLFVAHEERGHVLRRGREPGNGALPRSGYGRDRLPAGLGAPELGREARAGLLAVSVTLLADLAVELLAVVAALLPASQQIGHVRVQHASPPLVGRTRWWLGEVLVAVDGAGADAELATDVPEIRPGEV